MKLYHLIHPSTKSFKNMRVSSDIHPKNSIDLDENGYLIDPETREKIEFTEEQANGMKAAGFLAEASSGSSSGSSTTEEQAPGSPATDGEQEAPRSPKAKK